jgi:hypothetical protein
MKILCLILCLIGLPAFAFIGSGGGGNAGFASEAFHAENTDNSTGTNLFDFGTFVSGGDGNPLTATNSLYGGSSYGIYSSNYFSWNRYVGWVPLVDNFRIWNPGAGNKLADAGGVYAPNGQTIMDNNGNFGPFNGGAITNLTAANLIGGIGQFTIGKSLFGNCLDGYHQLGLDGNGNLTSFTFTYNLYNQPVVSQSNALMTPFGAINVDDLTGEIDSGGSLTGIDAQLLFNALPALDAGDLFDIPAAALTGILPGLDAGNLNDIPAASLTGKLPALDAGSLTNLTINVRTLNDATNLTTITNLATGATWISYANAGGIYYPDNNYQGFAPLITFGDDFAGANDTNGNHDGCVTAWSYVSDANAMCNAGRFIGYSYPYWQKYGGDARNLIIKGEAPNTANQFGGGALVIETRAPATGSDPGGHNGIFSNPIFCGTNGGVSLGNLTDAADNNNNYLKSPFWVTIYGDGSAWSSLQTPASSYSISGGSASVRPAFGIVSQSLVAIPVAGAIEYDGASWYGTDDGATRRTIITTANAAIVTNAAGFWNAMPGTTYDLDIRNCAIPAANASFGAYNESLYGTYGPSAWNGSATGSSMEEPVNAGVYNTAYFQWDFGSTALTLYFNLITNGVFCHAFVIGNGATISAGYRTNWTGLGINIIGTTNTAWLAATNGSTSPLNTVYAHFRIGP